jgi:hypothetical protein
MKSPIIKSRFNTHSRSITVLTLLSPTQVPERGMSPSRNGLELKAGFRSSDRFGDLKV